MKTLLPMQKDDEIRVTRSSLSGSIHNEKKRMRTFSLIYTITQSARSDLTAMWLPLNVNRSLGFVHAHYIAEGGWENRMLNGKKKL